MTSHLEIVLLDHPTRKGNNHAIVTAISPGKVAVVDTTVSQNCTWGLSGVTNVVINGESGLCIEGALTHSPTVSGGNIPAIMDYLTGKVSTVFVQTSGHYLSARMESILLDMLSHPCVSGLTTHQKMHLAGVKHVTQQLEGDVMRYHYDLFNRWEAKYLHLCKKILALGVERPNRTGVNSKGVFHKVLRFPLSDFRGYVMPLLTTKKMYFKSVVTELLWFLRAETDISYLKEHNVHIWDMNTNREHLDARGLTEYAEGVCGPIYGNQWRAWGREYGADGKDHATANKPHVDQLAQAVSTLKTDPWNRRIVVSAWNVGDLDKMALPPCHYSFQFHVELRDGRPVLNCLVNMRSADLALGVPFNVASYALLTHIVAHLVDLTPGTLSLSMCDTHIYTNHTLNMLEQTARSVWRFPTFVFSDALAATKTLDQVAQLSPEDFTIKDYKYGGAIKYELC